MTGIIAPSFAIREATADDGDGLWAVLEPVIRAGESYTLPRDMTRDDGLGYWMGPDRTTFVLHQDGAILGTYYLRANQQGGGAHVCNCGFITAPSAQGKGIARQMATHALAIARARGFRAMQFNFVVSTNDGAVRLWKSLGFDIVGTLPLAFDHPIAGYVDAFVMYRHLLD